jgi:hypothetical protein
MRVKEFYDPEPMILQIIFAFIFGFRNFRKGNNKFKEPFL